MNKEKILNEIQELEEHNTQSAARIEELRKLLVEPEKKLQLWVNSWTDSLHIRYGERVGHISAAGECSFLNNYFTHELIEEWRDAELPVDKSIVEWRGGKYRLDVGGCLERLDVDRGRIYSFTTAYTYCDCADTNIQRYSNGQAKLFG